MRRNDWFLLAGGASGIYLGLLWLDIIDGLQNTGSIIEKLFGSIFLAGGIAALTNIVLKYFRR